MENTIIEKNNTAFKNCSTFVRGTDNGTIRCKYYNKVIQSIESAAVREKVGNQVAD